MRKTLYVIVFISLLLFAVPALAAEEGFKFYKSPEIKQQRTQKPVRIKLKRLESGKYTWELTGDSAEDIIEADKKLREYIRK